MRGVLSLSSFFLGAVCAPKSLARACCASFGLFSLLVGLLHPCCEGGDGALGTREA